MASNATSSANATTNAGPPPGLNFIAIIQPGLTFSLLGGFFAGMLIPLLVFLFMFSTPPARRHPVFILNVAIVILGMGLAAVNVGQEWSNLVSPDIPIPDSLTLANISLNIISPLIIDTILIFRLLAFFPRITTPRSTYFQILAFPVVIKSGRFICDTLFLYHLGKANGQGSITVLAASSWYRNPYLVSEWSLQICDNLYLTTFFFWKLRKFYSGGENNGESFRVRNRSLLARLRGMFVIALANFVFPLFLNITQVVLITRDTNYARGAEVLMTNMYISIFGVLFATVWANGNAWGKFSKDDSTTFESTFTRPGYLSSTSESNASSTRLPKHYVEFGGKNKSNRTLQSARRVHVQVEEMTMSDLKESQLELGSSP